MKQLVQFKRIFAAVLLLAISTISWANGTKINGIYYVLNSSTKTASVTYTGTTSSYNPSSTAYTGSITIPSTVTYNSTTYSVTSIGERAFYKCSTLTSITIPNSVTSIGNYAFYNCSGLTSVTIPNSVTSIGEYAFYYCTGLTSITIPNSVTSIGNYAFYGCSGLTSVTIPESVTSIGSSAFSGCSSLASVTLNANVIASKTYTSSSNIGTIFGSQVIEYIIGNDITCIGSYAFYGCSGLTSITIPESVTSIGDYAFSGCSGLTKAEFASIESLCKITFNNYYSNPLNNAKHLYIDGQEVTDVIIPNSVTSIGDYTFHGCSGLTSMTIPNSVTRIGEYAFSGCSGLTSITIPESVTSIGDYAFSGCSGLTKAEFASIESLCKIEFGSSDANPLYYAKHLYINGQEITDLVIPNSVTSIGKEAFYNCSGLTSITIPNSVTSIGISAFSGCSGLTSVTIPNSVTRIGEYAFSGCSALTSVTLNANDIVSKTYSSSSNLGTIFGSQVKEYVLGDDVKGIGNYAFSGCSSLTSVTIPNSVTSIGEGAFYRCSGLTSVTIPNSVTSIGCYAFYKCTSLTSVTIPNSVTSIGECAFSRCSGLTSVTIPNSLTSIGNYAFESCSGLTSIKVNTGNPVYDSRYNCNAIIETKTNTLIQGCKNTIIPEGVTSIGEDAFVLCTGLTSINIPSSVTSISDEAFDGCTGLQAVYCDATNIPTTGKNVFRNIASATLYVPESMVSKYRYKTPWSDFSTISPFPYFNVDGIYYNIYTTGTNVSVTYNPTSPSGYLSIVEIPSTVKYNDKQYIVNRIGTSAFSGCSELTSVTIPNSVTSIGMEAFSNCSGLTSVTIPNSVTSIGSSAFAGCPLQTIVNQGNKKIDSSTFSDVSYIHAQLYVPEGTAWDYIYNTAWGQFHHIKEFASKADDIRNDAVYMIADRSGRNFPVYDKATKSLKNVAYTLNIDDNDTGACWQVKKNGGDTFLYNIGARMYASYDLDNNLALSIAPTAVNIEVTEDGATINGRPVMLVANKSLTPVGPEYILGDANGNGEVEIGDVTSVLTLMATPEATGYNNKAADANGNGVIEIGDVTTILTIMANGE